MSIKSIDDKLKTKSQDFISKQCCYREHLECIDTILNKNFPILNIYIEGSIL